MIRRDLPDPSDDSLLRLDMEIVEMRVEIYRRRRCLKKDAAGRDIAARAELSTREERLKGMLQRRKLLKRKLGL